MLGIGDRFILTEDALENYGLEYKDVVFVITRVATSVGEHLGYDEGMEGMALYDAGGLDCSVYEYEVEEVD